MISVADNNGRLATMHPIADGNGWSVTRADGVRASFFTAGSAHAFAGASDSALPNKLTRAQFFHTIGRRLPSYTAVRESAYAVYCKIYDEVVRALPIDQAAESIETLHYDVPDGWSAIDAAHD